MPSEAVASGAMPLLRNSIGAEAEPVASDTVAFVTAAMSCTRTNTGKVEPGGTSVPAAGVTETSSTPSGVPVSAL
jgi:hypothetical protein